MRAERCLRSARHGKCQDEAIVSLRLLRLSQGVERTPPLQLMALLGCRLLSDVGKGTGDITGKLAEQLNAPQGPARISQGQEGSSRVCDLPQAQVSSQPLGSVRSDTLKSC